jgi:hypothetical protein
MMKDIPPGLLDEIVRRLAEALRPEEIYLFGSHAQVVQYRADMDKWASVKFSLPYEATHKGKQIYAAGMGVGV